MNKEKAMLRLSLRLPEEVEHSVRREASMRGQSMNQVMLRIIIAWLKRNPE